MLAIRKQFLSETGNSHGKISVVDVEPRTDSGGWVVEPVGETEGYVTDYHLIFRGARYRVLWRDNEALFHPISNYCALQVIR